jgi:opacity protein-like surface antigen
MRRAIAALCAVALLTGPLQPGWAEDSDRPRLYLGLRGQDTNPWTGNRDLWGVSLGANFNEFLGAELSVDTFERRLKLPGFASVGEQGIVTLVPQLRLRYPVLDRRLTPYLVGGAGVALSEFNDRKEGAFGRSVTLEDETSFVGTLGAGVEYFVADNIAVGVEVKYLFAEDQTVRGNGVSRTHDISSLITTVGLRLFYPELRPAPPAESADSVPTRVYLAVRAGGALALDPELGPDLETSPGPPAYGDFDQYFGMSIGLNFGRHWGAELLFDGFETDLEVPGLGSIREYAIYTLMPQARFRYPMLGGALVPYAVAGVGLAIGEVNDRKPHGATIEIEDNDTSGLAATVGAGIEYFVTRNIAFGLETKYLYTNGLTVQLVGGPKRDVELNPIIVSLGLRVFLADLRW